MSGDLLERIEADRVAARAALADERAVLREKFPYVAEVIDAFRVANAADPTPPRLLPRPVYATNAQGETWGREPKPEGLLIDGEKLAHLPAFEASWRAFFAKQKEDRKTYGERMQRAVKPLHPGVSRA